MSSTEGAKLVYVDTVIGNDTDGDGSANAPYLTASHALDVSDPQTIKIHIRVAEGELKGQWAEITQSALKKATRDAQGIKKKREKAEQLALKNASEDAAKRERQAKRIEESKQVTLTEDSTLPTAIKVWFVIGDLSAGS